MIASLAGVAALVAAIAWAALVLALFVVMLNVFTVLRSAAQLIDGIRRETVPLLAEVRITVSSVNRELDRADGMLVSAGNVARSVERLSSVVERTVSSPLIKLAALGAGASAALRRLRKGK